MSNFQKEGQNHNTADVYMLYQHYISLDHILIFIIPKETGRFFTPNYFNF
jgi:hypothetical protein